MPLNVTLELPADLEEKLRRNVADLNAEVRGAFLAELFRRGKISHFEISRALRLDRFQTDAWLKQRGIYEGSPMMEDLESDRQTFERLID